MKQRFGDEFMRDYDIAKDYMYYPKYELGRLCWFKTYNNAIYCGHYAGFYCDNFEAMHIKHMVSCGKDIYSVDGIFETQEEVN